MGSIDRLRDTLERSRNIRDPRLLKLKYIPTHLPFFLFPPIPFLHPSLPPPLPPLEDRPILWSRSRSPMARPVVWATSRVASGPMRHSALFLIPPRPHRHRQVPASQSAEEILTERKRKEKKQRKRSTEKQRCTWDQQEDISTKIGEGVPETKTCQIWTRRSRLQT